MLTTTRDPHPTEGWTELHRHPDGLSYWRRGERHRAQGWAVDREGAHEAWLFGRRLPSPEHDPATPLVFAGQDDHGRLGWLDRDGALRASQWIAANGLEETRWLDADGRPERHRAGGYHRARTLGTGERRFFEDAPAGPRLHRLDGPAIEDAASGARSQWFEQGIEVDSPSALLNDAKRLASVRVACGLPVTTLALSAREAARVSSFVRLWPDEELSWELSVAFPDAWIAGRSAAGAVSDWRTPRASTSLSGRPPLRG
jgi:hypothetical protein